MVAKVLFENTTKGRRTNQKKERKKKEKEMTRIGKRKTCTGIGPIWRRGRNWITDGCS